MILAISRFRVVNGMEADVRAAFQSRPHLVDSVPGFLGMETFTEDAASFYLVTRWTDVGAYRTWHSSPEHRDSHAFIPKGLKLDPEFTRVVVLDRIPSMVPSTAWDEFVADAAPFLADTLSASRALYLVVAGLDGTVRLFSPAVAESLEVSASELSGSSLWSWLTESDARMLRDAIARADRGALREPLLVNFAGSRHAAYTLRCRIDVQPDSLVLVGERLLDEEHRMQEELLGLNNRMATLGRENARQRKRLTEANARLEKALEELDRSYWHLRKIQEVLPICMDCGRVKTADASWDTVADYFRKNSLMVSHGYCPDCAVKARAAFGLPERKGAE
jgi:heme-degrading monooxygenase HmoA